ncbi:MAG: DivIVA domain-containing protein [Acidobacteriota bacterium]|nr:DivIVA domain-containing protein [Thermoanaerobaculaceae bacterium]
MVTKKHLSPIEIQSHNFRTQLKGYDKDDVKLFLSAVAESYQELSLENASLRKEVERLSASLDEFKSRENLLKDALYLAQKTADDLKSNAEKEAETILKEAELKGEKQIKDAMVRAHLIERQIMDIKIERENTILALKDFIARLSTLLEAIEKSKENENIETFAKEPNP